MPKITNVNLIKKLRRLKEELISKEEIKDERVDVAEETYISNDDIQDAILGSKINEIRFKNNSMSDHELMNVLLTSEEGEELQTSAFLDIDPKFSYNNKWSHVTNMKLMMAPTFIKYEKLGDLYDDINNANELLDFESAVDEFYLDYAMTYPSTQLENSGLSTLLDVSVLDDNLHIFLAKASEHYDISKQGGGLRSTIISDLPSGGELELRSIGRQLNAFLGFDQDEINLKTIYGTSAHLDSVYRVILARKGMTIARSAELIGQRLENISKQDGVLNVENAKEILKEDLVLALRNNIYRSPEIGEVIGIKRGLDLRVQQVGIPQVQNIGTTYLRQAWNPFIIRDFVLSFPTEQIGINTITEQFMSALDLNAMARKMNRVLKETPEDVEDFSDDGFEYSDFNPESESIALRELARSENVNTIKPISVKKITKIIRNIIKKMAQKKLSTKKGLSPVQTGERFFIFKDFDSFFELNNFYGVVKNLDELLYSTMDKQIRSIVHRELMESDYVRANNTVIPVPLNTIFELAMGILADSTGDKRISVLKSSENTFKNGIISLVRSQFRTLIDPLPAKPLKGTSAIMKGVAELWTAKALGKLGIMSSVADGLMLSIFGRSALGKNTAKLLIDYYMSLFKNFSKEEIKILGTVSESIRTGIYTDLGYSTGLLNKLTGLEHVTRTGIYNVKSLLCKLIANGIVNEEMSVLDNLVKEKILSKNDISYLKKNQDSLIEYLDGVPILNFVKLNRNMLETDLQRRLLKYVNNLIPVQGLTSKSISQSADYMNNPVGFLIKTALLFKGIVIDHSKSLFFDPLILGGNTKTQWARMLYYGFVMSLGYQLIKHLLSGQVPITEKDKENKATREIIMTALLDSPMFGVVGSTIKELAEEGYKSPVGTVIPRHYGSLAKIPLGLTPALKGDFGKSANKEISAINSFNPVSGMPAIGILFDRLVLDGLRDLVYPEHKKYYRALNTIASSQGYKYLTIAKPDSFYGGKKNG